MVVVLMGVAGSGKTTVGRLLANQLGWAFADGDDFHSAANIAKMAAGQPLTDEDRAPWLQSIRRFIEQRLARGEPAVVACSALKQRYRDILKVDPAAVRLVYLAATPALIEARLAERRGHFLRADLAASQFAALEPPGDAVVVDASASPEVIVTGIRRALESGLS